MELSRSAAPMDFLLLILACLPLLAVCYRTLRLGRRDPSMPPGPPTVPVLGNLHQIPVHGLAKKFLQWGEEYGEVFSLKIGTSTAVVLNSRKAIHEFLQKQGAISSARPQSYLGDIMTQGHHILLSSNAEMVRQRRKLVTQHTLPRVLDGDAALYQESEASVLLLDLLNNPENFYSFAKRYTASVTSILVYGHRGPKPDSFFAQSPYSVLETFTKILEPGASPPFDVFTWLQYLPSIVNPWKSRALAAGKLMRDTWTRALEIVIQRRHDADVRSSIADQLLDDGSPSCRENLEIAQTLGEIMEGGSDTSSSQILTILLALAKHPEVQRKARGELDAVCRADRSPRWSDFESAPYVNCVVKEGLRWRPVGPLALPHRTIQDSWYNGMYIPRNSTVFIPVYALHHSERHGFKDPARFNPDRYLHHPQLASYYASSPDYDMRDGCSPVDFSHHYTYGAGRRICPGIQLGERVLWRAVAKLLWAFDISEPLDPVTGEVTPLDPDAYTAGLVHKPLPFALRIVPRSLAHAEVIRSEGELALALLKTWE